MRVLVCGGRTYTNSQHAREALDAILASDGIEVVIEGGALGADIIANNWAHDRQIPTIRVAAEWDTYGKAAGPVRNAIMLKEGKPDLCLAFPGGRGTANMVKLCRDAGVRVIEVAE